MVLIVLLTRAAAGFAAPADAYAFVTQQVCVDAHDRPVMGDPVHCPARRGVRVGEAIPYRRVDAGNWQAFAAYPVLSPGGERRAMVAKIFGGNDTSGSFGDLGVRSGYDLLEIGPDFVSGIRTSDQGAGDQIFWRTSDCARSNGWIFFPPGLQPGGHGEIRSTLKITKGPSIACPTALLRTIAPDYTVWDRPLEPVRYTSGKLLDSIVSMHFAYGDPADPAHDNDSMEKFYFTLPYGYSRWEAWETPEGCRKRAIRNGRDAVATCQPYPVEHCSGPNRAVYFGKLYLRLDCRDDTFYVADTERPFDPLVSDAAPGDVLSRNLLRDGTFVEGATAWDASPGVTPEREARSNNAILAIPAGGHLRQEVVVPPEVSEHGDAISLRLGAALAGDGASSTVHLLVALETDGGTTVRTERVVAVQGTAQTLVRFDVPLPASPARIVTGQVSLDVGAAGGVRVDDVFLTPMAATAAAGSHETNALP